MAVVMHLFACFNSHVNYSLKILSFLVDSFDFTTKMPGLGFGIDRGGTFTDVFVVYPDGKQRTFKLLSEDTNNYQDAPTGQCFYALIWFFKF
jgi:hypothetical protein